MSTTTALIATLSSLAIFVSGCASNAPPKNSGGEGSGLLGLIIIGIVIWLCSKAGQYRSGYVAGRDGKPKGVERFILSDRLKESYDEGYRDGQLSNLSGRDHD
jgi:hypothetical protein